MKSRLPKLNAKHRICIICEGDEEYDYLNRLKQLQVWHSQYEVTLDNAQGNGNIFARYQDRYQNGNYELVLVLCDTDKKPYEQYVDIKRKINEFHDLPCAEKRVIFFCNPCIMQVILSHFDNVKLTTSAKKMNSCLIETLTGVANYKAKKKQRDFINQQITHENFKNMLDRVRSMSSSDIISSSSNFDSLMDGLLSQDAKWIRLINQGL